MDQLPKELRVQTIAHLDERNIKSLRSVSRMTEGDSFCWFIVACFGERPVTSTAASLNDLYQLLTQKSF